MEVASCLLRACGTHFVSHKVAALERVVARFGVYLAHVTAVTEDSSMQPAQTKNDGLVMKWQISQILLGCTLFRDILRPLSIYRRRKSVWLGFWRPF